MPGGTGVYILQGPRGQWVNGHPFDENATYVSDQQTIFESIVPWYSGDVSNPEGQKLLIGLVVGIVVLIVLIIIRVVRFIY